MTKFVFGILMGFLLVWIGHSVHTMNSEPTFHISHLTGRSMEQYGLYDGMTVKLLHEEPRVGDIVSFRCVNGKCPNHNMLKVLKKQDGDCYWFQGRDDQWYDEKGEVKKSLDSRSYGWVCKNDLIIGGILDHETHNTKTQMLVCK